MTSSLAKNVSTAVPNSVAEAAGDMVGRADEARDARRFHQAAFLYEEAVRLLPARADLHVQAGHMFKEAGLLGGAERHYEAASAMMPNDADLALQLGHFFKSAGRIESASAAYRRSLALKPGWADPKGELLALGRAGWRAPDALADRFDQANATDSDAGYMISEGHAFNLAPELSPKPIADVLHAHGEEIAIRRLGRRERTYWGVMSTLRGVQSFRGFCISDKPILKIEILIRGLLIYRGGLQGGFEIPHEAENPNLRKYVFNAWIDLSGFVEGRYEVEYRAINVENGLLTRR